MKTSSSISRALLALLAAGLAANLQAYTWGGKLDMLVVAEQTDSAVKPAPPTAALPTFYAALDGGYIESGDPIGGLKPPPASAIAQALGAALASQHYVPATTGNSPAQLLIYHWGLLNRDSRQIRTSLHLQPNLVARIGLVSTDAEAARIEEDLLDRRQPGPIHPPIIDPQERDLIQFAADNRYFVIVSAYDFASVARGDGQLLWRVKLSTRSVGTSMAESLTTLLQGGAPYFGHDVNATQMLQQPLAAATTGLAPVAPAEFTATLNQPYLDTLIHQEHVKFSGELPAFAGR